MYKNLTKIFILWYVQKSHLKSITMWEDVEPNWSQVREETSFTCLDVFKGQRKGAWNGNIKAKPVLCPCKHTWLHFRWWMNQERCLSKTIDREEERHLLSLKEKYRKLQEPNERGIFTVEGKQWLTKRQWMRPKELRVWEHSLR